MQTAACRNKGFIIDGYPRNINDGKNIFLHKVDDYQPNLDSEGIDTNPYPGFNVDSSILPQYVVVI